MTSSTNPLADYLRAYAASSVLYNRQQVAFAVDQLAVKLTVRSAALNPVALCVMNGGMPFFGYLLQRLRFPLQIDYAHVGSYRDQLTAGELSWYKQPSTCLRGRHVLLIDDILDRGNTLRALTEYLNTEEVASATSVVLVEKEVASRHQQAEFAALTCPDQYLFGWGMDYQGYGRNLDEIRVLPSDWSN